MRRLIVTGAAALLAAAVAACGSSAPSASGASANGPSGTLTISNEQGTLWNCSFNPFNPSNLGEGVTMGQVYEPLAFVDTLENGKATPWLATSWAWSDGNKMLTFTIRQGVKFNDGTPMTAADVAFTFNLMKKYPTLDVNSVWSVLSSVTQQGDNVVMTFKAPAVPYFYYIADQVPIVPEHVWSKISNPVTLRRLQPGRHRRLHGQALHVAEHHLRRQPALLAARRAEDRQGAVPGVHLQRPGQHLPGHRPGAVGQPVHPEHPGLLHARSRRTTTTGSRRSPTCR